MFTSETLHSGRVFSRLMDSAYLDTRGDGMVLAHGLHLIPCWLFIGSGGAEGSGAHRRFALSISDPEGMFLS
jgi:hypothetical protein